jgi:hypothetical protein
VGKPSVLTDRDLDVTIGAGTPTGAIVRLPQ